MEIVPIKTRPLEPPQDDLFAVLDQYLTEVVEGDIVAISSKVVAIAEGRCVPISEIEKKTLITQEADVIIPRSYWKSDLTITNSAFIGNAGIDESNGDGYYVLLPKDPVASARRVYEYLKKRFSINDIGVLITDSHSTPLRRGALGIAIGFWGFLPTISHVGRPDVFGRKLRAEVSNLIDGLAAGATVVMGETSECVPIVVMRGVPNVTYLDEDRSADVFLLPEEDTFRVLYQDFLT